jgi:hypothetical protein
MQQSAKSVPAAPMRPTPRKESADRVPFILRSWWLRDFADEYDQQFFEDPGLLSLPLWSLHSDPKCDTSCVDFELF